MIVPSPWICRGSTDLERERERERERIKLLKGEKNVETEKGIMNGDGGAVFFFSFFFWLFSFCFWAKPHLGYYCVAGLGLGRRNRIDDG